MTIFAGACFIALCAALVALAWTRSELRRAQQPETAGPPPQPGMALLNDFRCHRAETKRVIVRGEEDNFSPAGEEPTRLHPRLQTERMRSQARGGMYDRSQPDAGVYDYFELPRAVSRGLFVISFRDLPGAQNDSFAIGDLSKRREGVPFEERHFMGGQPRDLDRMGDGRARGSIRHVRFADIVFGQRVRYRDRDAFTFERAPVPHPTLLDYVRAAEETRVIDVAVGDDTSVDFMAVAICVEPPRDRGLTLALASMPRQPVSGATLLSCGHGPSHRPKCDPYVGDTRCDTPLPLACFRSLDLPVPASHRRSLESSSYDGYWSGGVIATTPDVRGDQFRTIAEADAYCAGQFGDGWRTLTHHDGGKGAQVAAFGALGAPEKPVWIDIKGQPYGTCWTR